MWSVSTQCEGRCVAQAHAGAGAVADGWGEDVNDNNAVLLQLDQGDLIALAITEAYQREAADLLPDVPVMTVDDVERVGMVLNVLGGRIERVVR